MSTLKIDSSMTRINYDDGPAWRGWVFIWRVQADGRHECLHADCTDKTFKHEIDVSAAIEHLRNRIKRLLESIGTDVVTVDEIITLEDHTKEESA